MGKPSRRFVAEAEPGGIWRIRDKKAKKFWGGKYRARPDALIDELNGEKRPAALTKLARAIQRN